jgi:hypothetical protein
VEKEDAARSASLQVLLTTRTQLPHFALHLHLVPTIRQLTQTLPQLLKSANPLEFTDIADLTNCRIRRDHVNVVESAAKQFRHSSLNLWVTSLREFYRLCGFYARKI